MRINVMAATLPQKPNPRVITIMSRPGWYGTYADAAKQLLAEDTAWKAHNKEEHANG
jgi:hypothetical protein